MAGCGCGSNKAFDGMSAAYKRALWWVIAINGVMFFVEMIGGVAAQSQALQADALDFLGDTLTYGISLWAIGQSLQTRSRVAVFKGVSLLLMAAWVLGSTIYRLFVLGVPNAEVMGAIAIAAFCANLISVLLLMRYKEGDANVRSVWLCSRNDAIGNLVVLVAASGVWLSGTPWPDLLVALVLAALFTHSAWNILRQARAELAHPAEKASHCSSS